MIEIFHGGTHAMIQAVPRPDYTHKDMKSSSQSGLFQQKSQQLSQVRLQQRLFDPMEVRNAGGECYRKPHPNTTTYYKYDFWNNEYYRHGFLYKYIKVDTYLKLMDIKPRIEETRWFATKKSLKSDYPLDEDDDNESSATMMKGRMTNKRRSKMRVMMVYCS